MKFIVIILSFIFINSLSFAKETCIKNDKGIFCGTEVTVQDKDKNKRECVEFKGKKICGYDCLKNIWGADCKKEKEEECIANIKGVICGYGCLEGGFESGCASKPDFECVEEFGKVKCGTNCENKFGKFVCDENDSNAKYMR